jgi:hypothetical protein
VRLAATGDRQWRNRANIDKRLRAAQFLLGHDKLDTTARYARVATGMIAGIKSPLDLLSALQEAQEEQQDASEAPAADEPRMLP